MDPAGLDHPTDHPADHPADTRDGAAPAGPDPVAVLARSLEVLREHLDRLHRTNEELLAESRSRADDPLIRDLLLVVDSCARTARSWQTRDAAAPGDVADALRAVADDLEQVLQRVGVEAFAPEVGAAFERRVAQAVRVEESDGTANRVLSVVRPGYRSGERVLRHAHVVVSRAKTVE